MGSYNLNVIRWVIRELQSKREKLYMYNAHWLALNFKSDFFLVNTLSDRSRFSRFPFRRMNSMKCGSVASTGKTVIVFHSAIRCSRGIIESHTSFRPSLLLRITIVWGVYSIDIFHGVVTLLAWRAFSCVSRDHTVSVVLYCSFRSINIW